MTDDHLALGQDTEESIEGIIERITFHAPDTGWTVARLGVAGRLEAVPAVGTMLSPEAGESVRLFGEWQKHQTYGRQFRFERYQLVRPSTTPAIEAYLSGSLVDGIGPKIAHDLVAHFGEATLDILDQSPGRLEEVPGIGPKRAQVLKDSWKRHQSVHRVMVFLQEFGIGGAIAGRIYSRYGDQAIEVLEQRPYDLAGDIRGIGFLTADRIARRTGIAEDDPARVDAGLLHALDRATVEGHLYLPRELLIQRAETLLHIEMQNIEIGLERLVEAEELVLEPSGDEMAVYAQALHLVETEVAQLLRELIDRRPVGVPTREQALAWLQRRVDAGDTELSDEQADAVATAVRQGLCVITGGPGTGKTTVTRAIVDACQALGKRVSLASPTGRAAKRLAQLAGHDASTIHRLLSYDPYRGGFRHGPKEPLETDVVILDEASMLDIMLARDVLRAIPETGQVILVGDADQLPSVGPGNVLRDIVDADAAAVCRLTQIFRQAEGSDIIQSAHLLNRGESPRFPNHEEWRRTRGDCILLEEEDADLCADRVILAATSNLPKMGFRARDVQVITPLHRGPIGVKSLNERLQAAINPAAPSKHEVRRGEAVFRQGDRVLQTVNNYDKGVYNGDIGFIVGIDPAEKSVTVEFDLGKVHYELGEVDEIALAYALTVHKSQGSEYPAVVIVIHSSHYIMLQRNLLYTALTRAEKMACIVGNQRGIWRAIRNVSERDRYTRLADRLRAKA